MPYGIFDPEHREYVITRPDTPRSWTNYLGNREFGGVITNNAGGYSFCQSSGQGRFTRLHFNRIPQDQPGRYFYIRDDESGDYWSASWQPVGKPLQQYHTRCHFGFGYARIVSEYSGIESDSTYYVPLAASVECWNLKLTNRSRQPRRLSVFSYVEFASEWHIFMDAFNLQYSMYTLRNEFQDGFIQNSQCGNLPEDPSAFKNRDQSRWWWMTLAGSEITGYDLDRDEFIGRYRAYHNPRAVETGEMRGSTAYGDNGCGGLKTSLLLAPGESREVMVLLGVGRAREQGRAALAQFGPGTTPAQLDRIRGFWSERMSALQVETPDGEMNLMLNQWSPYNALVNFYWCRSASLVYSGDERDGFGYRDCVQDCAGNAALIPGEVRARLELMLTGQESDGGAMPEVKPYAHQPGAMPRVNKSIQRSDDMLWHFYSIDAYVRETGDLEFYHKPLPYSDEGEDSVLGHLRRALEFNLRHAGKHGLPCGLHADWDDCIRMGPNGESVMVAFQMRYGLDKYAQIAALLGMPEEEAWAQEHLRQLDRKIQASCWDGEWFVRGFNEQGQVLGSKSCDEARIFHPVQTWAVISGGATREQAQMALDAVQTHLETGFGCMALMPPAVKAPCKEMRMTLLNPGQKENAGVFGHSQGWIVMANCLAGQGDRAYRVYRAGLPARFNDLADLRQVEPYCYCQSISSRYSRREGKGHIPWLTGSAGWSYLAPVEYILGIRPEISGLRIDPCLPREWPGFKATRRFRGKTVHIEVLHRSGQGHGVTALTVDGEPVEGTLVPVGRLAPESWITCQC